MSHECYECSCSWCTIKESEFENFVIHAKNSVEIDRDD